MHRVAWQVVDPALSNNGLLLIRVGQPCCLGRLELAG